MASNEVIKGRLGSGGRWSWSSHVPPNARGRGEPRRVVHFKVVLPQTYVSVRPAPFVAAVGSALEGQWSASLNNENNQRACTATTLSPLPEQQDVMDWPSEMSKGTEQPLSKSRKTGFATNRNHKSQKVVITTTMCWFPVSIRCF